MKQSSPKNQGGLFSPILTVPGRAEIRGLTRQEVYRKTGPVESLYFAYENCYTSSLGGHLEETKASVARVPDFTREVRIPKLYVIFSDLTGGNSSPTSKIKTHVGQDNTRLRFSNLS